MGGLFDFVRLDISVSDTPQGPRLGHINIPGVSLALYLNVSVTVFGLTVIAGHFDLI